MNKIKQFLALLLVFFTTFTYAQYCVTGCNDNAYINSVDPNTIEYDNMVSNFHSSIIKESNGSFKVWGQTTNPAGNGHLYGPTIINSTNGFNYTGTPLRATAASDGSNNQMALLTSDGLYIWGNTNEMVATAIKGSTAFGAVSIGTAGVANASNLSYSKGLPNGVNPADVKMLFGSYATLGIVTCTGEAWVLSFNGSKNGDGSTQGSGTNDNVWHRVSTAANTPLTNVVAMRGTSRAMMALTSDGKIYTWGTGTYTNDGNGATNKTFATEITKPSLGTGVVPKMIGMTQSSGGQSYYLLASDGKLYSMGENGHRQLGNGTANHATNGNANALVDQNFWVRPAKPNTANNAYSGTLDNVVWISPNEHDGNNYGTISVLTSDKKMYSWGINEGNMIGAAIADAYYDPIYMSGSTASGTNVMLPTDNIMAIETGGHTTLNIKECSQYFGYVGHKTNGSMGDGTTGNGNPNKFSYATSVILLCGSPTSPAVQNLKICPNTTKSLTLAELGSAPNGYKVKWFTDAAGTTAVANPSAVGIGTYYAYYVSIAGDVKQCSNLYSTITVSNYTSADPEYATCSGPDSDGDGIPDNLDLDDDNDGILDANELYCDQTIAPNGTFPASASPGTTPMYNKQLLFFDWTGVTLNASTTFPISKTVVHNGITYTATLNSFSGPQMLGNDILTWASANQTVGTYYNVNGTTFKEIFYTTANQNGTSSLNFTITAKKGSVEYPVDVVVFDAEASSTAENENITFTTNASNFTLLEKTGVGSIGSNITGAGTATLTYSNTQQNPVNAIYTTTGYAPTIVATAKTGNSKQGFGFGVRLYCDSDNDGNPNYLDLDSDNDGCLDAIEGGASITNSQLVNAGGTVTVGTGSTAANQNLCATGTCVDANGVPQLSPVPTGYSNTTGQSVGGFAKCINKRLCLLQRSCPYRQRTEYQSGYYFIEKSRCAKF